MAYDKDADWQGFRGELTPGQSLLAHLVATIAAGLLARNEPLPNSVEEDIALLTRANNIAITILKIVTDPNPAPEQADDAH